MIDYKALADHVAELEDQTATPARTGYTPPEAGKTFARFIEYIELGSQPRKAYQGQPKDPAPEVQITFELLGPKHIKEVTVNGETKKVSQRVTLTLTKSLSDKATFKKLFLKMAAGRNSIKHMAQMLGEGFIVTVVHTHKGEGNDKRTYVGLRDVDGSFLIAPPVREDIETGEVVSVKIPEPVSPKRLFLFNMPTKEQWDSIFIDGTYETKDAAGKTTTVSKNKYQARIVKAVDYPGSLVEQMLTGAGVLANDLADLVVDHPETQDEESEQPVEKSEEKKSSAKKTKTSADNDEAILREMGLLD